MLAMKRHSRGDFGWGGTSISQNNFEPVQTLGRDCAQLFLDDEYSSFKVGRQLHRASRPSAPRFTASCHPLPVPLPGCSCVSFVATQAEPAWVHTLPLT